MIKREMREKKKAITYVSRILCIPRHVIIGSVNNGSLWAVSLFIIRRVLADDILVNNLLDPWARYLC